MHLMMQMINGGLLLSSHYQTSKIVSSLYEMYKERKKIIPDVMITDPNVSSPLPCFEPVLSASSRYFDAIMRTTRPAWDQAEGPITMFLDNQGGHNIEKMVDFINYGHVYVTYDELESVLALFSQYQIKCFISDSEVVPIDICHPNVVIKDLQGEVTMIPTEDGKAPSKKRKFDEIDDSEDIVEVTDEINRFRLNGYNYD